MSGGVRNIINLIDSYNVSLTLTTYCIPIIAIVCLYIRMGLKLWNSQVIGESTVQQLEMLKSKRKVLLWNCEL